MSKLVFVGAVLLAACGPKGGGGTADPCKDPCAGGKRAAMTCDVMAANITTAMRNSDAELAGLAGPEMEGMFGDECTQQAWSQETIDCMAAASTEDDGQRCTDLLTPEQAESLDEAMDRLEDGSMGGEPPPVEDEGME